MDKELTEKCIPPKPHCFHQKDCPVVIEAIAKAIPLIQVAERERIANKIEADMPAITRYGALQYIRHLWQALKGVEDDKPTG